MTSKKASSDKIDKKESKKEGREPYANYPRPPFPKQKQSYPGKESAMKPLADHGEDSYEGSGKLEGKVALITGGDSGIGKAVAIAFAREGADLLISYLDDMEDEDAADTQKHVEAAGRRCLLVKGDITDEEHCQSLIDKTMKEFGRLDVLVNNAAFHMAREKIEDIPSDEWRHTFDVNVHAIFYLCKAAVPHMKPGSSIINTTSVNTFDPSINLLPYAATKAAIENYTANLSQILLEQARGIRVNAVAPGPVWTPLITSTKSDDAPTFGENTPIGRPGQPAELSAAFVFLASEESSYISGATIPVTGGRITIA